MRVLVLGRSSIATRRVLPALRRMPEVSGVEVATRRPWPAGGRDGIEAVFLDYGEALDESRAEVVYVSLVNAAHAEWAEAALASGRHVVVDKPAFLDLATAERLLALADRSRRALAEAVVFADHPQVGVLRAEIGDEGPLRAVAVFSMPPFAEPNFRYLAEAGGGCINDLGPYAAATAREFLGAPPDSIACRVLSRRNGSGVDTACVVLATCAGGRALVGTFGFDTAYRNSLTLLGPGAIVSAERIFTIPPDMEATVTVDRADGRHAVPVPAADCFEAFLGRFLAAVRDRAWQPFAEALHADARFVQRLREAAT